jgi:putative membrane protein
MAIGMLGFVAVIFVLLVLGGIAVVAFLVMRPQPASPVAFPGARETPLQILDRRFASGEITAEDYKKGRDILAGGGAP